MGFGVADLLQSDSVTELIEVYNVPLFAPLCQSHQQGCSLIPRKPVLEAKSFYYRKHPSGDCLTRFLRPGNLSLFST
jgi:hypothetical protein